MTPSGRRKQKTGFKLVRCNICGVSLPADYAVRTKRGWSCRKHLAQIVPDSTVTKKSGRGW